MAVTDNGGEGARSEGLYLVATLRPQDTRISVELRALKDIDWRATWSMRHAPRIEACPYVDDRLDDPRPTVIVIPTRPGAHAEVIAPATIGERALHEAIEYVNRNWRTLLLFWYVQDFGEGDLREELARLRRPVRPLGGERDPSQRVDDPAAPAKAGRVLRAQKAKRPRKAKR